MGWVDEPAWAEPLVGFAAGDDPLFDEMRAQIGDFYWTPQQAFGCSFSDVSSVRLTVISWVLPQTTATKRDNRQQTAMPAERWARSRKFGEECNDALHDHLVDRLRAAGVRAVAPAHLPEWQMQKSDRFGVSSCWSHRHAAYVAGLGTFGLCDGLITPVGKAMRCGWSRRFSSTPRRGPTTIRMPIVFILPEGPAGRVCNAAPWARLLQRGMTRSAAANFCSKP